MFDWSDLLLFLPAKVQWALLVLFCLLASTLVLWVTFG
jgi:hypothetical protein